MFEKGWEHYRAAVVWSGHRLHRDGAVTVSCKRTEPPVPPEVRPWLAHPCQSSSVTVTKCTMGISQMQKVPSGGGETLCSGWGPDLRTRRSGPSPIKPTYVLMGIPYIGFVAVAVTST